MQPPSKLFCSYASSALPITVVVVTSPGDLLLPGSHQNYIDLASRCHEIEVIAHLGISYCISLEVVAILHQQNILLADE